MRSILGSWWVCMLMVLVIACGGVPQDVEQTGATQEAVSGGATGFAFSALPATIQAGTTGTFTVRATDGSGNTATAYVGRVRFTANYPATTFSADYTFTAGDQGAHAFQFTPGAITGGPTGTTASGKNTVSFTAGAAGTLGLTCSESNGSTQSSPAAASINVVAAPQAPMITAPSSVTAGQTVVTASVTSRPQMTYVWAVTGGTISSAGGTSGVTTGATNSITFTAASYGSVSLTCYEVNALAAASAAGSATVTITGGSAPTGHLYVVAHQDDDLLFMNPDIEASIRSGHPTRMIFVTAAGSPDVTSWQAREHGVYTPYMMMANATFSIYDDAATYFTCGAHTYNGFAVRQCSLTQNPLVSLVFLRLGDGDLASLWDTDSGAPFYVTPKSTLKSTDNVNTYSKASLIATMAAIYTEFIPARIGTLDSTFAYGDDHADHVTSALLALEATHQWGASVATRVYRGYSMDGAPDYYTTPAAEAVNLSPADYAEKHAIMEAYGGGFPNGGTFDNWCHRRYAIDRVTSGVGPIQESGGGCLDTQGGSTADGTRVVVAPCNGAPFQNWTVTPDYQVAGPGGKCLAIGTGGAVKLAACSAVPAQKWTLFANGQLRGQNALCLTDNGDTTVSAALCGPDTSTNQWQPPPAQKFSLLAGAAFTWSFGTSFADADVGSLASSFRSLRLTDVDGDGYSDACIRLSGGVYCAGNGHVNLNAYTLFGDAFSDANGYFAEGFGGTVQYADVNGDHVNDACSRNANGLVCAIGTGAGFGQATSWSNDFSDSSVFINAQYYRSVHFGDVNGDGYADVCGRAATGVSCALNTTSGSFAPATTWINTYFTDAGGFAADASSSTVQLADVNGDGKADVCGRAATGLFCATSNGTTAFVNDHKWSFRADFADSGSWATAAGYYGSIILGDVNGDGLADACGRNANGALCAFSEGASFEQAIAVQPKAFTDALGWKPDAYGTSLRIGDVNHDGKGDLCGRSASGLTCSLMP